MANWDMFRELENLRREIDEAFRGVGAGRFQVPPFLSGARRVPQVNLSEDDQNVYVEALVPGVNPKELDMTVLGNTLTIAGERKVVPAEGGKQIWHRNERGAGKFQRTIEIPMDVDANKIAATCQDGILTVKLPKTEAAKPKKIAVTVA